MQKDEAIHRAIQDEINNFQLGDKNSKQISLDELRQKAPVLTKEILLATATVNNVTDKDKPIEPPEVVELNLQQGRGGKFGMGYGGTLRFDVDQFSKIDMPEFRTVLQHEFGHHAEFVSRSGNEQQPTIKDSSDMAQVNKVRDYSYTKEFQADWYVDALSGIYSHLKAVQRKPDSYVPVEKSPDHPDRKSRITALMSELYVPGSEKSDMPQSGDVNAIVANRTKGMANANNSITSRMAELDALVKSGLTDENIDKFVDRLGQSVKHLASEHIQPDDTHENQSRYALANLYMLNPAANMEKGVDDTLAPLYVKRQLLLNEASASLPAGDARQRLEVEVESRFDVSAYQQITTGRIPNLQVSHSNEMASDKGTPELERSA